ncbi:MAG: hypothetical protein WBD86_03760 [Microgenomates group bacterium]
MEPQTQTEQSQPEVAPVDQTQSQQQSLKTRVLKQFPKKPEKKTFIYVLAALLIVSAGVGTGWLLSGTRSSGSASTSGVAPGAETGPKEAGIADEATFRDSAEGILEEGGVDGEGTHHLVREGGPSQSVYLTSTVIDLQGFVSKTVQVWGETISAQKAGWLMDVGKIKVIE